MWFFRSSVYAPPKCTKAFGNTKKDGILSFMMCYIQWPILNTALNNKIIEGNGNVLYINGCNNDLNISNSNDQSNVFF